ncbi:MAG: anti-sigma factor antagonist [Lachnospiraceae bacterium]|nr:anti-sigma factor antagonist [Lachnospiraceae bacterium]
MAGLAEKSKITERIGNLLLVRVPEELDHHVADQVRKEVDMLLKREDIQRLVFDFTRTVFCDSSGIGMLMGRYKMMRALGGEVQAVHVDENVYRILRISGITKLISVNGGE